MSMTEKRIAALDAIDFNWAFQDYVTRTFDKKIQDLEETGGHTVTST